MSYKFNFGEWDSIFAIPTIIVDKYINTVDVEQIKVLLFILKNSNTVFTVDKISEKLNIEESKVNAAINFWVNANIIKIDEDLVKENNQQELESNTQTNSEKIIDNKETKNINTGLDNLSKSYKKKDKIKTYRNKLENNFYVSNRIESSEEITYLMQEAQIILGNTLSNNLIAILLSLHDDDGLPIDVILMLLQYTVTLGKTNSRYIEKVGRAWAEEEINTIEKVEEKIIKLNNINSSWERFEKLVNIKDYTPNSNDLECTNRWFNVWKYSEDLILEAYNRCLSFKKKLVMKYIDTIIKNWMQNNIYSISQLSNENKYSNKNTYKKSSGKPSYNISEYENYSIFDEIK